MSPSSDFKEEARSAQSSKSGQPNIQDVFLNYVRREKLTVRIRMMDGSEIDGRIKNFDRFALVVDQGGSDQMVFKHAIASIKTPKSVTNYFSHQ
jgi:host factor-I protein